MVIQGEGGLEFSKKMHNNLLSTPKGVQSNGGVAQARAVGETRV